MGVVGQQRPGWPKNLLLREEPCQDASTKIDAACRPAPTRLPSSTSSSLTSFSLFSLPSRYTRTSSSCATMASGGSRPSWQTAELSEEWPMSSTSSSASPPAAAARAADASSSSSVVRQHANAAGSGRSVLSGNDDDDDKAPGTFLVRTDVPETHVLEGPLARLRAGANGGAGPSNGGGSGADYSPGSKGLFSPLRLESMFQPPSPPAPPSLASTSARADQQDGRPPPNDDERRLSLPEVTLTPPPPSVAAAVTTESTTPIRLPPSSLLATACSPPPSPSAPTPSPMPRSAAAAATTRPPQLLLVGSSNNSSNHLPKQLAHAPQVPSRLQKTFTPADLTASTIDPAADDDDDDEDADQTTAGGSRGREGGVGDAATADDDNDGDTGAVVFDQPANSLDFAGPEPSAASTLGQRGDQSAREWPATFEFECRPPAAVSSSPSESVAHDSFGSFGPLPVAHSTPADRSSASSSSSADIRSGALGAGGSTVKTTTTTPAAEGPSARKLHLFRPTYDTFTREFMSALVDTIEEGGSPSSSSSSASTADESSRRARAAATGRIFSDRDVAVDFRDAKRIRLTSAATSSNSGHNRNRTSPGGSSGGRVASGSSKTSTTASSSFGRLRRSKASAFEASAGTNGGHGGGGRRLAGSRTSRDWDGEARELMQRVRNLGRSTSPSTTAATATTTAAAATSSGWRPTGAALISVAAVGSRVLSGSSGEGRGWGQGLALSSTAGSETGYGDDGGSAKLGEGRRIGSTRGPSSFLAASFLTAKLLVDVPASRIWHASADGHSSPCLCSVLVDRVGLRLLTRSPRVGSGGEPVRIRESKLPPADPCARWDRCGGAFPVCCFRANGPHNKSGWPSVGRRWSRRSAAEH